MAAATLPLTSKVELALGADLTAHPASWTWTTLTYGSETRLKQAESVQITRGRADESGHIQPAKCTVLLENSDGALTPRKATSPHYPYIRRGTPLRYSISAGDPHLLTTGAASSRAGTVDHADFPTGDWFIGVEVEAPVHFPDSGVAYEVAGKYNGAGQRSILLSLGATGLVRLRWSVDGTAELLETTTVTLPRPITGTFAFGAWLDVVNGANHVVTFYAAPTLAAITADPTGTTIQTVTTAGNTSVFNSTSPFDVGDVTGSGFSPWAGRIRRVEVRGAGPASAIVANPNFTIQAVGATTFPDTAPTPKTWTVTSPAVIENWQTRFVGQLSEIKPVWPIGDVAGHARVKIEASGMLQRLQQGEQPIESALYRAITSPRQATHVVAYWPHEDGRDSAQIGSAVSGVTAMSVANNFSLAADDSLPSSKPLMTVSSGNNAYMSADIPQIPQVAGVEWEITRFFRIDDPAISPAFTQLAAVDTNGRVATWRVFIDSTQVSVTGLDDDGAGVVLSTFAVDSRMFDTWAMCVLDVTDNGVNVDWSVTILPIPAGVTFSTSSTFVGNTGVPYRFRNSLTGPPSGVSVGHLVVTNGVPINWLAPADTGYIGERAAARILRLCNEEGQNVTVVGDPTTSEPMGPQRPLTFTGLVAECAEADGGVLSELPNTVGIGYRCRNDLYNQTVALTLDADLNLVNPFEPTEDDQRIVNEITVTRTEGSSHKELDAAHQLREDRYPSTAEGNFAADTQLPSQAGWRLHEGTWPEMRSPSVAADLVADSAIHTAWLAADLGDTFTASNLPAEHPTSTADLFIEGYTETISAQDWDLVLANSPAGIWGVGVLEDATYGRLDTAGSETSGSFIAGTNTSLTVVTTLGPIWTTAGGDVPFDIEVSGCVLRVTAVSGATSPQTFTISTTVVNGVIKTIPTASAVVLAHPAILAL